MREYENKPMTALTKAEMAEALFNQLASTSAKHASWWTCF